MTSNLLIISLLFFRKAVTGAMISPWIHLILDDNPRLVSAIGAFMLRGALGRAGAIGFKGNYCWCKHIPIMKGN
jgi:hypothetical protein